MVAFKDHFSSVADVYLASRPTYPEALYDAVASAVPASAQVWEPGCGSGAHRKGGGQQKMFHDAVPVLISGAC